MTTIAEVRAELANIAGGIGEWSGSAYVGDSNVAGMVKVFRPEFDPRMVFGGGKMQLTFRCVAYAKRIDSAFSEEALDALAELSGDGSFIAAGADDVNHWQNVTVDYAQVSNVGEVAVAQWGDGTEYLACPFDVEVVW